LWFVIKPRIAQHFAGFGLSWYIIGYGVVRFVIEYFREPDENLGFILKFGSKEANPALEHPLLNLSLGQIFCFAMIIAGILLYVILNHKKEVYAHDNK
jgi:phosphatidylglycerol:prolipoprotein diacylglycerol transferase